MKNNVNPNRGVRKNNTSVFSEFDNNDEIIFLNKTFKKTSNNSSMLITDPLHNKKLLMLPIISIVFIVALISSMSYAYYSATTNTINSSYLNTTMSNRLACNFNVTNNSFAQTVTLAQFGQSNAGTTIFSNTINANISLNGVAGCQCTYSVYLYEDGGDRYVRSPGSTGDEFTYQTTATVNGASSPNSVVASSLKNFDACQYGSIAGGCRIGHGTIAVTTANTKVTHTYSLTTALYNTNYNQISLTNKTYKYRVGVEVMNCNFLNTNDYLIKAGDTSYVLGTGTSYTKTSIEEIYINNTKTVPSGVVYSWDVSEKQNGSIMAYLMNGSASGKYILYIGQDGGVRANPNSSYLFSNYKNLKSADLTNLITDDVLDMSNMFFSAGYNASTFNLTGLSNWNTSKVKTMNRMFFQSGMNAATTWSIGDISGWNVSNVTNMSYMFASFGFIVSSLSIGDLSSWNVSNVRDMSSMFYRAGYNATTFSLDLSSWTVSNVTDMSYMFDSAGRGATTWSIGDLSSWNVSKVTNMSNMFNYAGNTATTWSIGDISGWNVSNVVDMSNMFYQAAYASDTFNIGNLSSWNVSKVTNMSQMFGYVGRSATTWSIGDISGWNVSNVTNMSNMFDHAGQITTTFSLNLSSWNVSNVTDMSSMFSYAGYDATTWSIGDLSSWNVSNVTNMQAMFDSAGYNTTTWSIGNLNSWNVSNVTNMFRMFMRAGYRSTTWSIGDLSSWNVSNVTNMSYMFSYAGYKVSNFSLNLSDWNVSNVTNMSSMFAYSGSYQSLTSWSIGDLSNWNTSNVTNMSNMFKIVGGTVSMIDIGTLEIYASDVSAMFQSSQSMSARLKVHSNPTTYTSMFNNAATATISAIVVDYSSATTNIDAMIATKTSGSNVIKGILID